MTPSAGARGRQPGARLHAFTNLLVRLQVALAPRLPRPVRHRLADLIALILYCGSGHRRRVTRANFAAVLGPSVPPRLVARRVRRAYRNCGYYLADLFHFLAGRDLTGILDPADVPLVIRSLVAEKRGLILLTAHLGNWELGAGVLAHLGLPISVVYARDRFSRLEAERSIWRARFGVRSIEVGEGPLAALAAVQALARGEIVALQGDRDFRGDGLAVPFAGRSVRFPCGPAALSLASGAPLLPIFILMDGRGGYRASARPPIRPDRDRPRAEELARLTAEVAASLEIVLRDHLDQWYCFYSLVGEASCAL